jgi:hypothetical protein
VFLCGFQFCEEYLAECAPAQLANQLERLQRYLGGASRAENLGRTHIEFKVGNVLTLHRSYWLCGQIKLRIVGLSDGVPVVFKVHLTFLLLRQQLIHILLIHHRRVSIVLLLLLFTFKVKLPLYLLVSLSVSVVG